MVFSTASNTRKWFFCAVGGTAVLLLFFGGIGFARSVTQAQREPIEVNLNYYQNVTGPDKVIALTFDDGPDPEKSREIMAVLDKYQVPATFFILGSSALHYPGIVKEMHDAGYEIGNHTFSHSPHVHDSPERIALELNATNEVLRGITGEDTIVYRPPFLMDIGTDASGDATTPQMVQSWVAQDGYVIAGADIDSLDWHANSPEEVARQVLDNVENGHIVLLHDGGQGGHTAAALEIIIPQLQAEGYHFETVSEVLGLNAYATLALSQTLALGDADAGTGGEVTKLQTFLLMEGYYLTEPTGVFDEETALALSAWQSDYGIPESGFTGEQTRSAMAAVVEPRIPHTTPGPLSLFGRLSMPAVFAASETGDLLWSAALIGLGLVLLRFLFIVGLALYRTALVRPHTSSPWRRSASVIIPAHNEEENIAATIESVLQSSHPVGEIIVVDDGSTDNTASVARSVAARHAPRVRLIETAQGGKAAALMHGVAASSGEVVVTIDSDTVLDRFAIQKLLAHFNDQKVDAVAGRVCVVPADKWLNYFQRMEYAIGQQVDKLLFATVNAIGVIPGPIGAWRRSSLIAAGGYSGSTLVEDQDATLALLASGGTVHYEGSALAYTEPPHTLGDFLKQRLRWTFGTLQCLWKYRMQLANPATPGLGFVVLPNIFIFGLCVPLLYPIVDLMFLLSIPLGLWQSALILYLLFTVTDLIYGAIGLRGEPDRAKLIALLPLQRIFYRFVMYFVVVGSIALALEGASVLWGRVRKQGEAYRMNYNSGFHQTAPEVVTTSLQGPGGTSLSLTNRQ